MEGVLGDVLRGRQQHPANEKSHKLRSPTGDLLVDAGGQVIATACVDQGQAGGVLIGPGPESGPHAVADPLGGVVLLVGLGGEPIENGVAFRGKGHDGRRRVLVIEIGFLAGLRVGWGRVVFTPPFGDIENTLGRLADVVSSLPCATMHDVDNDRA